MMKIPNIDVQHLPFTPELDRAYRLYAAKTIEDRALPDARDGLKPVQRRILYAMYDMGLRADRPQRKCARIVGEVLGKYHPHGDQAVYGALVRMAQDFTMRHMLVDGQGNFGSVDGDGAAAMRYTEARLSSLGETLLADIGADTVDWVENFDNSLSEPSVLPAAFPNLLVNGASGIAVGMATNIPPHNLGEIADAVQHVVTNWDRHDEIGVDELMEHVPGPDFPTGGIIYRYRDAGGGDVVDSIRRAYEDGAARIITQARMHLEDIAGGKQNIVITELPYNVQKATLLERIAKEVKDGRIQGLTDLRDESDYEGGMRVVAEVSRTASGSKVMGQLLKYSQLQETFGVNAMALVPDPALRTADPERSGVRPVRLTLRDMLVHFVAFRLDVIERRTRHELARREERLHIVEGLLKALDAIDEVVAIIRRSKNPDIARERLMKSLKLTEVQARAILDMPLRRLTALETGALRTEAGELQARIRELRELLASERKRLFVVGSEMGDVRQRYATPRKTVIIDSEAMAAGSQVVTESDLRLPSAAQVIAITTVGIERRDAAGFRYAPADGLTSRATTSHVRHVRAEPGDEVLLISSGGRAWRNKVGFVPERATFAQLGLGRDETVVGAAVLPSTADGAKDAWPPGACLVLGTLAGRIKRTLLTDLSLTAGSWSAVIGLPDEGDGVALAGVAGDGAEVLFATRAALVLRTAADAVNPQASGTARGVAGIGLKAGDAVAGGALLHPEETEAAWVFVVSARGYVKRVPLTDYPPKGRGSQGVQTLKVTPTTGPLAAFAVGAETAGGLDVFFANGKRQRISIADIPVESRYSAGGRLIELLEAGDAISGAAVI